MSRQTKVHVVTRKELAAAAEKLRQLSAVPGYYPNPDDLRLASDMLSQADKQLAAYERAAAMGPVAGTVFLVDVSLNGKQANLVSLFTPNAHVPEQYAVNMVRAVDTAIAGVATSIESDMEVAYAQELATVRDRANKAEAACREMLVMISERDGLIERQKTELHDLCANIAERDSYIRDLEVRLASQFMPATHEHVHHGPTSSSAYNGPVNADGSPAPCRSTTVGPAVRNVAPNCHRFSSHGPSFVTHPQTGQPVYPPGAAPAERP